MDASPGTSTNPNDPRYGVAAGPPPTYKPSPTAAPGELVIAADPATAAPRRAGTRRTPTGRSIRFVTWHDDAACGAACPGARDGKRITVAVSVDGPNAPEKPIVVSTVLTNTAVTARAPDNPAGGSETGPPGPSGTGSGGTGVFTTLYLYDTPGMYETREPITEDHGVHDTKVKPDLAGEEPPPAPDDGTTPPLFNYARTSRMGLGPARSSDRSTTAPQGQEEAAPVVHAGLPPGRSDR